MHRDPDRLGANAAADRVERAWARDAIACIEADARRSADTHLVTFPLPPSWGIDLYLKDESTHPTGSLKHRLARSLFLYGLCNGWIDEGVTIVEASSGSTAVSEAYFARMLGLPFVAVVPASISPEKIALIEHQGGRCHLVTDSSTIYAESARLADQCGGLYIDQFTYAERATDWRGNNNIAESIFEQMALERHPVPAWVVVGAGTGGTSATIGRYVRYRRVATRLCVVDPQHSVFADYYASGDARLACDQPSRIEGIGRQRVEPSFIREVIDRMECVDDASSLAAMQLASDRLGRSVGGSTGTNLCGAFRLIAEMLSLGRTGSVVSLICDGGERYRHSYYDAEWLASRGLDLAPSRQALESFLATGAPNGDHAAELLRPTPTRPRHPVAR
jgi:cysteine synthase A